MPAPLKFGLEVARAQLPRLVGQAEAGQSCVITRHGRPCAAIVPLQSLQSSHRRGGLLMLRGTGGGLWPASAAVEVKQLRDEWA